MLIKIDTLWITQLKFQTHEKYDEKIKTLGKQKIWNGKMLRGTLNVLANELKLFQKNHKEVYER